MKKKQFLLASSAALASVLIGASAFADETATTTTDTSLPTVDVAPTEVVTTDNAETTPNDTTSTVPDDLPTQGTTPTTDDVIPVVVDNETEPDTSDTPVVEPIDTLPPTTDDGDNDAKDGATPTSETPSTSTETDTSKSNVENGSEKGTNNDVQEEKNEPINQSTVSVSIDNPIVTDSGYTIIGVSPDSVSVQTETGDVKSVTPNEIGAKTNEDGSITVKSEKGSEVTLPQTGSKEALVTSIIGYVLLAFSSIFGFKKTTKNAK